MEVIYDRVQVTPHQLHLAELIEAELKQRVRYERTEEPDSGNGPSILFKLATRHDGLTVSMELYQDSFHIYANEAEVRIGLSAETAFDEWKEATLGATTGLFGGPLRIRVRRPSLMKWLPSEGSIYLSDGSTGVWSGDLGVSGAGVGDEAVFEDWYRSN